MNANTRFTRATERRRSRGVTLIELMVVVFIIGVLAAIAMPSYRQYTLRTHRTEAKSALMQLAANQERFYLQNNQYSLDPAALGFTASQSENGVYDLAIATVNGVTLDYVATATPNPAGGANGINQSPDAQCATFTIDAQGRRTATPDGRGDCW
jgi:type IV pilus assembly protein PilE